MDFFLVLLICATAGYAGAVVSIVRLRERGTVRALQEGAVAAVGVAASFFLMVALANLSVFASAAAGAVFVGAVGYLALARDLSPAWRPWVTVGLTVLVTAFSLFASYLVLMAFVGAVGVYRLVRLRLRTGPSLVFLGTSLSVLIAGAVGMFAVALSQM
ncbi:hypothetical protein Val02_34990 [Virgisporangium aliadipatigenens]|uniref:Uncharacterized protein n=1 Tax=Virgisporangium aliadipatigenens TaxID=741659 RepID=A0A8J3YMT8_9ACTN|nr:hypothetical protein [Virgisporangium aliadipatigenens]GIJ46613.1 hypothetical protein Val02_34990 [Virgisporangium aliadipatigenens]